MAESDLVLSGVTKRFGGLVAVAELSLTVEPGRIHGLIGPNGAGKSTTIGLISGFIRPDAGVMQFGSQNLIGCTPSTIARLGVTRTFQQATPLAGLTVYENVLVGMHGSYRSPFAATLLRTRAATREAHLVATEAHKLVAAFGLDSLVHTDAKLLTFGQLRFLEIARVIATRPKIVLLDEPAAGLNQSERDQLAKLIRGFRAQGIGVLLVDHDVPFVFGLCDRMTVMNFGTVIASGEPSKIRVDPKVREAYLGADAAAVEASA